MLGRSAGAAAAAAALAGGLLLSFHHPLSARFVGLAFVLAILAFWRWPFSWPTVLFALLPAVALAPWSGWITFEEWDLLVLAVLAAGCACVAQGQRAWQLPPWGPVAWIVIAAYAASQAASVLLGLADAGGFSFGWFQGYREPMNTLRLAKPLAAALALVPLWSALQARNPQRAGQALADGLCLALAAIALAALAERHAYTSILNFNTDYRTSALFWEMHVGGAALDGFLALTMPFAVRELLRAPTRTRSVAIGAVVVLATYACLTTFSRIVYLAIPTGLAAMLWLQWRQAYAGRGAARWQWLPSAAATLAFVAVFAVAATTMFPTSGYRGMLALFGCAAALLVLPRAALSVPLPQRIIGTLAGVALALACWAVFAVAAKGAYLAYAGAAMLAAAAVLTQRWHQRLRAAGMAAIAACVALVACTAFVALHWGGAPALSAAAPALTTLTFGVGVACFAPRPLWPQQPRWQALTASAMVLAAIVVSTFAAGVYMSGRFTTSSADFAGRIAHWRQGLSLLQTPTQQAFGRGLGRFVDNYAYIAGTQQPGDYRLRHDASGAYLTLSAGLHELGWGELLRVSQRIALPHGPTTVALEVRADKPIVLHVEVCLKHLIYVSDCAMKQLRAPARPGEWQTMAGTIDGGQWTAGPWYARKWVVFSVASETPTHVTDLRAITVTDATGRQLLANGNFDAGLARWFTSSDRNHLPWHIKNVEVNVAFEQGFVGLLLFVVLLAGALWRISLGAARTHPLAPAITGALVGFLVVGQFDSLLDVPRAAFLFYWLVLLALALPPGPTRPTVP